MVVCICCLGYFAIWLLSNIMTDLYSPVSAEYRRILSVDHIKWEREKKKNKKNVRGLIFFRQPRWRKDRLCWIFNSRMYTCDTYLACNVLSYILDTSNDLYDSTRWYAIVSRMLYNKLYTAKHCFQKLMWNTNTCSPWKGVFGIFPVSHVLPINNQSGVNWHTEWRIIQENQ